MPFKGRHEKCHRGVLVCLSTCATLCVGRQTDISATIGLSTHLSNLHSPWLAGFSGAFLFHFGCLNAKRKHCGAHTTIYIYCAAKAFWFTRALQLSVSVASRSVMRETTRLGKHNRTAFNGVSRGTDIKGLNIFSIVQFRTNLFQLW